MTTLIDFNLSLLDGYDEWEKANINNWNISSYLNKFYSANTALAFSKFFFPSFIEKRGCVVLDFRFNELIFNQWFEKFSGDITLTEKHCNLYDVADYFHISQGDSSHYYQQIETLSLVMVKAWEINCRLLFPHRKMVIEPIKEYGETYITIYTKSID